MSDTTIYGIANCDTMRKARAWLDAHGVECRFHDYRRDGVDGDRLKDWCGKAGWERLLNKAGTTFRALPDSDRTDLSEQRARRLMEAHPALIKRPVLEHGGELLVGFKPEKYAALFGK